MKVRATKWRDEQANVEDEGEDHNVRSTIVTALRENFGHLNLTFSIGGQISFDVINGHVSSESARVTPKGLSIVISRHAHKPDLFESFEEVFSAQKQQQQPQQQQQPPSYQEPPLEPIVEDPSSPSSSDDDDVSLPKNALRLPHINRSLISMLCDCHERGSLTTENTYYVEWISCGAAAMECCGGEKKEVVVPTV
ncbi:hypothetical protein LguiA_029552 [Lonicera macranthoides]